MSISSARYTAVAAVAAVAVITFVAGCGGARGAGTSEPQGVAAGASRCVQGNGGITLAAGFCATIFADSLGAARHMAVAPSGEVFVTRRQRPNAPGGVIALRDANGDGRADATARFGVGGETGIGLSGGFLYLDARDVIVRYPIAAGSLEPSGPPDTIVMELPTGGHGARNFVIDGGSLFVNIGSRTNSCQVADRQLESPGIDPCTELETRAGIWRFDANRKMQRPSDGERFATGIRNAVAMERHPVSGELYAIPHGRDQFFQNWPKLYNEDEGANLPSEEMQIVARGANFGWPYCYYDPKLSRRVLAPEYGGDKSTAGRCAAAAVPVGAYPAHWAPNDIHFYTGSHLPARYREGAFIAFHGSWNRAPLPQGGYRVVFQPMRGGRPEGDPETFADGFAGANVSPTGATHRPTGLAQMPDGSLLISDDVKGRIWRVYYGGGRTTGGN